MAFSGGNLGFGLLMGVWVRCRMFIPVGNTAQYIWVIDKDKDGKVKREQSYAVSYVPLTDAPKVHRSG